MTLSKLSKTQRCSNSKDYERSIRHLKYKKELAERDEDPESVRKINQSIRGYQATLRKIVKDNDFLARQYDREQIVKTN